MKVVLLVYAAMRIVDPVIPREGVERPLPDTLDPHPTYLVIPREGVESFWLPIDLNIIRGLSVIPREGVESSRTHA